MNKSRDTRRRVEQRAGLPFSVDQRTHIRWQNEFKELKKEVAW